MEDTGMSRGYVAKAKPLPGEGEGGLLGFPQDIADHTKCHTY